MSNILLSIVSICSTHKHTTAAIKKKKATLFDYDTKQKKPWTAHLEHVNLPAMQFDRRLYSIIIISSITP